MKEIYQELFSHNKKAISIVNKKKHLTFKLKCFFTLNSQSKDFMIAIKTEINS